MEAEANEIQEFKDDASVPDQEVKLKSKADVRSQLELNAKMGHELTDSTVRGQQDEYETMGCVPGVSRHLIAIRVCQPSFSEQLVVGKFYLLSRSSNRYAKKAQMKEYENEKNMLLKLGVCEHVVDIYDYGFTATGQIPFIMIERLGKCIENYTLLTGYCRFSDLSGLLTMRKMVEGLKEIHDCGIVSRDIKLANFCMKTDEDKIPLTIKLIDFGHAVEFHESDYQELHEPGENEERQSFFGTRIFASRAAHMGLKQVPYDDLESLFYSCVRLFGSNLPWTYNGHKKSVAKKNYWAHHSQGYRLPLDNIYKYIRGLKRSQPLNHDELLELIDELIDEASEHVEYGKSKDDYPMIVRRDENYNADSYLTYL